jgi:hypothetical protein
VLGYGSAQVELTDFSVAPDPLHLGQTLKRWHFTLHNTADTEQNVVIDFVIHFVKANGQTSGKVFKLKTAVLAPNDFPHHRKKPSHPPHHHPHLLPRHTPRGNSGQRPAPRRAQL